MLWKQEYHNKRYMNFAMTRTSNWKEFYREPRMVEMRQQGVLVNGLMRAGRTAELPSSA